MADCASQQQILTCGECYNVAHAYNGVLLVQQLPMSVGTCNASKAHDAPCGCQTRRRGPAGCSPLTSLTAHHCITVVGHATHAQMASNQAHCTNTQPVQAYSWATSWHGVKGVHTMKCRVNVQICTHAHGDTACNKAAVHMW